MPVNDIIHMDHNDIMLSKMLNWDGYTDGLYIGTPYAVKLCMNHLDIIKHSYENTIKRNIERHNLNVILKLIRFSKIRANMNVLTDERRPTNRLITKIKNCHDDNYKQLLEYIKSND